jgi:hypothetical protein
MNSIKGYGGSSIANFSSDFDFAINFDLKTSIIIYFKKIRDYCTYAVLKLIFGWLSAFTCPC